MDEETATYPKHVRSTIRRLRERARYDFATVHAIFSAAIFVNVSFLPTDPSADPFPTILPMLGTVGSFENPNADPATEPLDFYLHGHASSRLMKLPGSDSVTEDSPEGLPVCISATLLDGIKLTLTPFTHNCNFRSAVLHGYANLVTDEDEKEWALRLMVNDVVPNRWENARNPPTKAELQTTTVLRIRIVSASAKINTGSIVDDRKDLQNEEATSTVWTGVVPVWEHIGPPVASETNKVAQVPPYMNAWIQGRNTSREKYGVGAAAETMKDLGL
jgi:nitroimidazol reductase NimA-like FMN-containing flavoprotein (pyridoxamine 5'-phosphate oxidase superfamily)